MRTTTFNPTEIINYAVMTAKNMEEERREIERKVVAAEIKIKHYEAMLYNGENRLRYYEACCELNDARRDAWEKGVDIRMVTNNF